MIARYTFTTRDSFDGSSILETPPENQIDAKKVFFCIQLNPDLRDPDLRNSPLGSIRLDLKQNQENTESRFHMEK